MKNEGKREDPVDIEVRRVRSDRGFRETLEAGIKNSQWSVIEIPGVPVVPIIDRGKKPNWIRGERGHYQVRRLDNGDWTSITDEFAEAMFAVERKLENLSPIDPDSVPLDDDPTLK